MDKCRDQKFLEINGTCVTYCRSYSYEVDKNGNRKCVNDSCNGYFVADMSVMKKCVENCPEGYNYVRGSECVKECEYYVTSGDLKKCQDSCYGDYPFSVKISDN